ncbi:MAG: DGQHR domain-containing protein [Nitrospiraceae bacterium]|nr:DGQHR domain-containing protein [Nitrospiraceae bacterium]
MAKLSGVKVVELVAFKSDNLDTICYRGHAPLAHLSLISQPDVFDQVSNPSGLQRDLSPKHASDAYEYATRPADKRFPRAYPEVVLNVRDKNFVEIEEREGADKESIEVRLSFDLSKIQLNKVHVSRVDGNHRLFYAAGDDRRDPILSNVPFQIHVGLTRDQERSIFVDINSNQKGLNTSHLDIMQSRLTAEEQEIKDHLDRWIAKRLSEDPKSPWHGLIHHGGSKQGSRSQGLTRQVNFVSIKSGTNKLLSKSQYIHDLTDPEAQYVIVRNYWNAIKTVFAEEWSRPKEYLLLKNVGVWSLSFLGGTIIDRCLPKGEVDADAMEAYLQQIRDTFDWRKTATGDKSVAGMSGNRAAMILAGRMAEELRDEKGISSIKKLQDKLKAEAK